jgi:hypothetical protein
VTPVPREPAKGLALLEEVKALLAKDAITRIHGKASDGFFSTFFLTAKKSFRMETLAAVLQALQPGYWGATVDLKDAYLHVSVHHQSRKCLRFCIAGQSFEFKVLPFGLSTSPRVFTRVVKVVAEFLRPRGYVIFMYLDDFLVVNPSREGLQKDLRDICSLLRRLGFLLNEKKSVLIPSQQVQFLGATLDFASGRVYPVSARVEDLQTCASLLRTRAWVEARTFLRLLGLMSSMVDMIPWCRLHMRPLQLHLAAHYRPWVHPLDRKVPVLPSIFIHPPPGVVDESPAPLDGCRVPSPSPHPCTNDGCVEDGVGWSSPGFQSVGSLVSGSESAPHQHPRTHSSLSITTPTADYSSREVDTGPHRQYCCGGVPQQAGRHSKSLPLQGVDPTLSLVREQADRLVGGTCSRRGQSAICIVQGVYSPRCPSGSGGPLWNGTCCPRCVAPSSSEWTALT